MLNVLLAWISNELCIVVKHLVMQGIQMIPDYLTFIRFQDKRNLYTFMLLDLF